jgi:hypothetical protein
MKLDSNLCETPRISARTANSATAISAGPTGSEAPATWSVTGDRNEMIPCPSSERRSEDLDLHLLFPEAASVYVSGVRKTFQPAMSSLVSVMLLTQARPST